MIPRIGVLISGPAGGGTMTAFQERLREHDWLDGQNVVVDYRSADNDARLPALAAELVALEPTVIVAARGNPPIQAAQQATTTIPIVMTDATDPVGAGLVRNLQRPEGNLTGVVNIRERLTVQRMELLHAAFPDALRVAVIFNPDSWSAAMSFYSSERVAEQLGMEVVPHPVRAVDEIAVALATIGSQSPDALLVLNDPLLLPERERIVEFANGARMPAMYGDAPYARAGGLLACNQSGPSLYRRAATYVDQILRGAQPAELAIVQPEEGYVVVNMMTAHALGFTLPPAVLVQASELIF